MRKILLLIIFIVFINILLYSDNNSEKYNIIIIPLLNISETDEYDHISMVVADALKAELEKSNNYVFFEKKDVNLLDKFSNKIDKIILEDKLLNFGKLNNIDLIIYGDYKNIDEIIIIHIKILNVMTGKIDDRIFYKGDIGLDLYRIVDEASLRISDKVKTIVTTLGKEKRIEFNIGGSYSYSFSLVDTSFEFWKNGNYYNDEQIYYSPFYNSFIFAVPFSFIYYPKNIFGFGFSANMGFSTLFVYSAWPIYFDYITILSFVNSFDHKQKTQSFLLEYGLVIDVRFYNIYLKKLKYMDNYSLDKLTTSVFIGPHLFIAYKKNIINGFSLTAGGFIQSLFLINPYYFGEYEVNVKEYSYWSSFIMMHSSPSLGDNVNLIYKKYFISEIKIGFEIRCQFMYLKKLKK